MTRTDVILHLIEQRGYTSYLEIGCAGDTTFSKIPKGVTKVGVDPQRGGTLRMVSDEFFTMNTMFFDIVFVDGDHRHPQVFRDVSSALRRLNPGGVVVMHDCLPPTPKHEGIEHCGTTWRVFAKVRERPDLEAFCGDFDFGVGVIHISGNTAPIKVGKPMSELSFEDLKKNRDAWMRPLSAEDLFEKIAELHSR